jgi:hypothetical protein
MFPLRLGKGFERHCLGTNIASQFIRLLRSTIFASAIIRSETAGGGEAEEIRDSRTETRAILGAVDYHKHKSERR